MARWHYDSHPAEVNKRRCRGISDGSVGAEHDSTRKRCAFHGSLSWATKPCCHYQVNTMNCFFSVLWYLVSVLIIIIHVQAMSQLTLKILYLLIRNNVSTPKRPKLVTSAIVIKTSSVLLTNISAENRRLRQFLQTGFLKGTTVIFQPVLVTELVFPIATRQANF